MLRTNLTKHFSTVNEDKNACIFKRFNRTLWSKIHRTITGSNRGKYVEQLQSIVDGYNKIIHNSLVFKPNDITHGNTHELWFRLHEQRDRFKNHTKKQKPKLGVEDYVRIVEGKTSFKRGFAQR